MMEMTNQPNNPNQGGQQGQQGDKRGNEQDMERQDKGQGAKQGAQER